MKFALKIVFAFSLSLIAFTNASAEENSPELNQCLENCRTKYDDALDNCEDQNLECFGDYFDPENNQILVKPGLDQRIEICDNSYSRCQTYASTAYSYCNSSCYSQETTRIYKRTADTWKEVEDIYTGMNRGK